jgi:FKBP-type peptidyl-prolyl cis-trans isomerase
MRTYGILVILGLVLAFIAFQARTGIFRVKTHEEPANKYMREIMQDSQLTEADATILRQRYDNAHINPSGLRYIERNPGVGDPPNPGSEVVVQYDCYLLTGKKVDSSRDRGAPDVFRVGTGHVIKGLDEAIGAMKRGERRTLIIPWWLAYGEKGQGATPPRSTLVYEIELVDVR